MFLFKKCSRIMLNVVQSGASRQDYYKKARNKTTKTKNYVAKKMEISYTSSFKSNLLLFQTDFF